MSSRRSFSLGKALSATIAAVPSALGGAWLGLLLLWAATAAWPIVLLYLPCCLALVAGVVVLWLLKLVALGGLYRTLIYGRTAGAEGRGPGGVQFGAPEMRLLFATLIIALFMAVIVAASVLVFAVAFNMSSLADGYNNSLAGWHAALMRHHSAADWTFIVLPLLMGVFLVFVAFKLVLAPVATIAEKRTVTLNAMGLSAGNVGKLFVGVVLLSLPFVLAGGVLMHHMPHNDMTHVRTFQGSVVYTRFLAHAIAAALAVGVLLPLQTGFLASAYRQIVDLRAK